MKETSSDTMKMLYDGYDCVADYDDSGTPALLRYYITPNLDENILVYDEENTDEEYFYLHDGLGTVRQIVDTSQNVENQYDYEGFGTSLSSSENIYNRYRYTGRVIDTETESTNSESLYYYRARMYDTTIGSFTSRDPIPYANLYTYCSANPMKRTDSLGLDFVSKDEQIKRTEQYKLGVLGLEILKSAMGEDPLFGNAINAALLKKTDWLYAHEENGKASAFDILTSHWKYHHIVYGPHIVNKGYKSGPTGFKFGHGSNKMNIQYRNVASAFNKQFDKTLKRCFTYKGMCCKAVDTLAIKPEDIVKELQRIVAAQVSIHELIHMIGIEEVYSEKGEAFWKSLDHNPDVSEHHTEPMDLSKGGKWYNFLSETLGYGNKVVDDTLSQVGTKENPVTSFTGKNAFHFMEALMWNRYKDKINRAGWNLTGSSNGDVTFNFVINYSSVIICDDKKNKQSVRFEVNPWDLSAGSVLDPISKKVSLKIPQ